MTVTSGKVTIKKDESNLIGISIGGGAPLCPCLYVVQVRVLKSLTQECIRFLKIVKYNSMK